MTITRADETYLINDTYKDCAVSGNIVYHTDGSKNISVSLNKDDKYISASINDDSIYIAKGTIDSILILEYLSINLNVITYTRADGTTDTIDLSSVSQLVWNGETTIIWNE